MQIAMTNMLLVHTLDVFVLLTCMSGWTHFVCA